MNDVARTLRHLMKIKPTEPIINGLVKVRDSEKTDATPCTSVGSPA